MADERLADARAQAVLRRTYFPPEDRWGRPGFVAILTALAQAWANEQEQLLTEGERVTEALRQYSGSQNSNANSKFQRPNPESRPEKSKRGTGLGCPGGGRQRGGQRMFQATRRIIRWRARRIRRGAQIPRAAVFNFLFRSAVGQSRKTGTATWIREKAEFSPARPDLPSESPAQP